MQWPICCLPHRCEHAPANLHKIFYPHRQIRFTACGVGLPSLFAVIQCVLLVVPRQKACVFWLVNTNSMAVAARSLGAHKKVWKVCLSNIRQMSSAICAVAVAAIAMIFLFNRIF